MNLEVIVVGILGLCLIGIFGALIFNARFRRDLIAQPGKVSIFGVSVEGVVIVLLAALMLGGILFSLDKYASRMDSTGQSKIPSVRIVDLPFSANGPSDALEKIHELARKSALQPKPDLVAAVKTLNYDQPESEEIRTFPLNLIGPWAISGTAKEKFLTVPSEMKTSEVRGCPGHLNKKFEVRSRLPDDTAATGGRVEVQVASLLTIAKDCEKRFDFIQVSCDIAKKVFAENVVDCDKNNQPKWKSDKQKLPIWFTQVSA